jgi:hypothetical protein
MAKDYAKIFPSIADSLKAGPTRAVDIYLRNTASAVASGAAPTGEAEAQLNAEWNRLSPSQRAEVARDFPLLQEELERQGKARLTQDFPSLAAELRAAKGK